MSKVLLEDQTGTFKEEELAETRAWVSDFTTATGDAGGQPACTLGENALTLTVRPKGRFVPAEVRRFGSENAAQKWIRGAG